MSGSQDTAEQQRKFAFMTNANGEQPTGSEKTLDEKCHRLVKKKEVAFFLSVTPRTIEHMVRDGRIPVIRIGRTVRFCLADILDHLRTP